MGVLDGQPVSAAVTNPAFLDADSDDTALGKISFNNISDPSVSGSAVNNIQREINAISSYTGKATNLPIGTTPSWTNNQLGTSTDSLFIRSNTLTGAFDGSLGHIHDGTDGQGPLLPGSSLSSIPLMGFIVQGVTLTGVTGSTWNVTTQLTGKTPSTGDTSLGVVVNTPYNKVILRDPQGTEFTKTGGGPDNGAVIYGRVTEAAGVWTLSFYYLSSTSVETSYSFATSETIDWYYQELYAPNISTPVYSPISVTPSDNTTSDVVDATETTAGKVLLANVAPPAVASASAKGTDSRVAHQDHTHEGVHSVQIDGNATVTLGDVVFKAGAGISLAWVSGKLEVSSSVAVAQEVEYRVITSVEATAKQLTLAFSPTVASQVMLDVIGGGPQYYSVDYIVSGTVLSWSGLGLDSILATGDVLRILYWH